jgi:hypothetical protein
MTSIIRLSQYTLASEAVPAFKAAGKGPADLEYKAVATWQKTIGRVQLTTYYWNNVPVTAPYQLLNDSSGNPIWIIEAIYTFSDVSWRYARDGEVITDFCGKRGQVDNSFTCPKSNIFQLVPAAREKGGGNVYFPNNGCYNPGRVRHGIGGRLMVIPNDRVGTYDDNSGAFDVKVEVVEFLP